MVRQSKEILGVSQSSTGGHVIDMSSATPPAKPLDAGEQAYQLAISNKNEIDQLRDDINNPQWTGDLIKSQISLNRIIKISLWLFLLIFLLFVLVFVLLSIFQINNLLSVLEDIRNSKKIDVNSELINSFNQLFFYCRSIANFLGSFIGAIGIVSLLTVIIIKVSEKYTDSIKNK